MRRGLWLEMIFGVKKSVMMTKLFTRMWLWLRRGDNNGIIAEWTKRKN